MTRPSWRLTGLLVAVLAIGAALGFTGGILYASRHPDRRHHSDRKSMLDRLDHDLHFTPEQRTKVGEILERNFQTLKTRRQAAREEMMASREATRLEIESVLDEGQKEHYRRIVAELQSRWSHGDSTGTKGDH